MIKSKQEKSKVISFRLSKNIIEFLDYLIDGIYIRDRTHAIRLLIEYHYREWLVDKHYVDRDDYIKGFFSSLLKTEETKRELEDPEIGPIVAKNIVDKKIKKNNKKKK